MCTSESAMHTRIKTDLGPFNDRGSVCSVVPGRPETPLDRKVLSRIRRSAETVDELLNLSGNSARERGDSTPRFTPMDFSIQHG